MTRSPRHDVARVPAEPSAHRVGVDVFGDMPDGVLNHLVSAAAAFDMCSVP